MVTAMFSFRFLSFFISMHWNVTGWNTVEGEGSWVEAVSLIGLVILHTTLALFSLQVIWDDQGIYTECPGQWSNSCTIIYMHCLSLLWLGLVASL